MSAVVLMLVGKGLSAADVIYHSGRAARNAVGRMVGLVEDCGSNAGSVFCVRPTCCRRRSRLRAEADYRTRTIHRTRHQSQRPRLNVIGRFKLRPPVAVAHLGRWAN